MVSGDKGFISDAHLTEHDLSRGGKFLADQAFIRLAAKLLP